MKPILLATILLSLAVPARAQNTPAVTAGAPAAREQERSYGQDQEQGGQTLRGRIVDAGTQMPLVGANIIVAGTEPLRGTSTDTAGRYVLARIPLGRYDVRVTYVGYEAVVHPAVLFTAAKEVVLDVELTEDVATSAGVTVVAATEQGQVQNDMALVSARSFSVEETRRFAGGLDDPARLVSAYAGVSSSGTSENAIIVRGNSPKGVQWRLEGVEIPSPSHFAGGNVVGGGLVTLFSTHLLADSDFLTGAFPAGYGNALSGIFDMRLRTGNDTRREHTLQVGLMGLDVGSEGPLRLGTSAGAFAGASYLFNYRYSTLALLGAMIPSEQVPVYQDLSFKVNVPTRRYGRFAFWGIGGLDDNTDPEERDSTKWEYEWDRTWADVGIDVGVLGVTHDLLVGTKVRLQTRAAVTASRHEWEMRRLDDALVLQDDLLARSTDLRGILGVQVAYHSGRRHVNETGFDLQRLSYDFTFGLAPDDVPPLAPIAAGDGASTLLRVYSQSKVALTPALTADMGLHVQHFALTGRTAVEPRGALRWQIRPNQALSIGYGLHSQVEELRVYLAQPVGSPVATPNRDLGFAKAHHVVLGYDRRLGAAHMKVEAYYQSLFDVPVIADSSFSMINFAQDWEFSEALVNEGAGRNYGVELTVERFLRKGYYYLLTGSLFSSRYRGGDGVWRDTRWNRAFGLTALYGKEFTVGGDDLLGIGGRLEWTGGQRYSPHDPGTSQASQTVVFDERRAFTRREPQTYCLDVTFTYRRNHRHVSEVWALQIKNVLMARGFYLDYNYRTGSVAEVREGVMLPVLSYKIEF